MRVVSDGYGLHGPVTRYEPGDSEFDQIANSVRPPEGIDLPWLHKQKQQGRSIAAMMYNRMY